MFVADKINNAMVVVVVVMMREAKNVSEKKNCIHGGMTGLRLLKSK
jgi:hypothetical protein